MTYKIIKPEKKKANFTCPVCNVVAEQDWIDSHIVSERIGSFNTHLYLENRNKYQSHISERIRNFIDQILNQYIYNFIGKIIPNDLSISRCNACKDISIWVGDKMIHPKQLTAPLAHIDMPKPVKELYEEARLISNDSPRAAAALLRVALEKLTEELGEKTGTLNNRIGNLHKRGLPKTVISSLDIVRIFANEGGAHAGEIDLTGEYGVEIVNTLFWLVNIIVEKTISEPKEIKKKFDQISKNKRDGIKNRDKNGTD